MFKTFFFKKLSDTVKAGVQQDIDSCTGQLEFVKLQMTKSGRTFTDAICQDMGISEAEFYHIWSKEIVANYLQANPPQYPSQIKFVSETLPHEGKVMPETIADLIIRYKNSEFYGLCITMQSKGDLRGSAALRELDDIIVSSYRVKGLSSALGQVR